MKTLNKTAIAAILVILALLFVTCQPELLSESSGDDVEWVDWKYEALPDGSGRMELWLDGSKPVPVSRNQRGLSTEMAKMIHDYFEIVFVSGATIARTSWEIGQPAGISGVPRGSDYGPVTGTNASAVFVGKRQGKTLLGIGHLVMVKEGETILGAPTAYTTTITDRATSVTYAVYPLTSKIGFEVPAPPAPIPSPPTLRSEATFITAVPATGDIPSGNLTGATSAKTRGSIKSVPGNLLYPLFALPGGEAGRTIEATYTIGLTADIGAPFPTRPTLWDAAKVITMTVGANTFGLEVIKRTPSYKVQGKTMEATTSLDMYTTVGTTSNSTDNASFNPVIQMVFTQTIQSGGIFAITFQCPVYLITKTASTNTGNKQDFDKWYIRPSYNEYQYMLDNGIDAGGMVMLGSEDVGDVDWLEIYTTGIGFSN